MHWRNSDFQIAFFLAGKCNTPDEAYRMLCELKEERDTAIFAAYIQGKRCQAKLIRAHKRLAEAVTESERLDAEADVEELERSRLDGSTLYAAAVHERDFISELIERVRPLRKYGHLPDSEAHQASQREEWALRLIGRARTFLATAGTIPQDHLETMLAHPDFRTRIAPAIEAMNAAARSGTLKLQDLADSPVVALLGLDAATQPAP